MAFDIIALSRKLGLRRGEPQNSPAKQVRKKSKMRITKISEQFAVSPQISVEDVATAAAQGYKTIMCNRPDNEEFGQPSAQTIEAAAKAHGLDFHWVPVSHQGMAPDTLDRFQAVISAENGPILAYCRSGNRCSILWNMSNG